MIEIPIQKIIDSSFEAQTKREMKTWYISKLGSCLRGAYFERLGVEADKELTMRELRVFDMGNLVEEWVINKITKVKDNWNLRIIDRPEPWMNRENLIVEFDKERGQIRLQELILGISGRPDLIVEFGGKRKVYEVKSKHSKSFWYMNKMGEGAMRQHEYQLWCYLFLLGVDEGSIIYVSKDDQAILEYPVFLNNKQLREEVMNEINLLNLAWEHKKPELLPLPDEKSWKTKYCRYHSHCLMGEELPKINNQKYERKRIYTIH